MLVRGALHKTDAQDIVSSFTPSNKMMKYKVFFFQLLQ